MKLRALQSLSEPAFLLTQVEDEEGRTHLPRQLCFDTGPIADQAWQGRTGKRHRAEIRIFMMQQVLSRPHWAERLTTTDLRALTPLIWEHVNPYGRFELNMETRLDLSPNGP
jgi:hypothetical protein